MLVTQEEHMLGGRCGTASHVAGLMMPAERVLGMADPGRLRWERGHRVNELLWAAGRQAKGGFG